MSKVTKSDLVKKIEQATNARHAAEARVRDVEARAAGAAQDRDMRIRNLEAELASMKARPCESEHGRLDAMWQGMVRDLDEAKSKARKLEAKCAVMRVALESISKRSCRGKWDACGNADISASEAEDALASDAGRKLLERMRKLEVFRSSYQEWSESKEQCGGPPFEAMVASSDELEAKR
jgi:hypothetical protein